MGPPYNDDPGCKYVVIENPWPGGKKGDQRDQWYWNLLCTWMRFMLQKTVPVFTVWSRKTRDEVIVELPEEVDLVPIVGAHPWTRILGDRAKTSDQDKVSYVFAYDYRMKGEPGTRTPSRRPTSTSRRVPVPARQLGVAARAQVRGHRAPSPPMRQPTPVPDTSLWQPYAHPTQLTPGTVGSAEAQAAAQIRAREAQGAATAAPKAATLVDQKPEVKPSVKPDPSDQPHVKAEQVKSEVRPEPGPSEEFRATFEERQRMMRQPTQHISGPDVKPKPEEGPSEDLTAAFLAIRGHQPETSGSNGTTASTTQVKADPRAASPASEEFSAAFYMARAVNTEGSRTGAESSPSAPTQEIKPDPGQRASPVRSLTVTDPRKRAAPDDPPPTATKRMKEGDLQRDADSNRQRVKEEETHRAGLSTRVKAER
ncbi:uncharacterized protein BXZ73DRAFT_97185 [Epithele typhae]|uniref:uncharacterized protein n=1 Tax=Epithele typhae TaxID=378194 RepID=UPI00200803E1|nr:uncharacterized protein BXZ73DRAFT_97185 [Epithele typhae]KAH9943131.1 hypothetical protein BXZ73DRAFT_97185 [Epithele typhae]